MSKRLILGSGRWIGLTPIGEVAGHQIYPLFGAEEDGNDNQGEDDGDQEGDGDESEEDREDGEDESGKDKSKSRQRKQSGGDDSSVIRALRAELRNAKKTINAFKDDKKKADLADASDVEKARAELAEANEKLEKLHPRFQDTLVELEIIKTSSQLKLNWNDIEDVLNDRKLRSAIDIDDDGEITGVEEALKELKKRKPHFLAVKSEDSEEDSGESKQRKTSTGASFNGSKTKKDDRTADRSRLMNKYPVLQRMQESG
jgi:hypothetical protein